MQTLATENDYLADAKDDKENDSGRLLRDQEEVRLVGEFFNGRKLPTDCATACRNAPTGYWCLVVCKRGRARTLADDNTVAAGVDTSATTSTTIPALRDRRAKSNNNCLEFPMQVPALIKRVTGGDARLDNCKLEKECLILRECFDE
jgi:hypothetical protein